MINNRNVSLMNSANKKKSYVLKRLAGIICFSTRNVQIINVKIKVFAYVNSVRYLRYENSRNTVFH